MPESLAGGLVALLPEKLGEARDLVALGVVVEELPCRDVVGRHHLEGCTSVAVAHAAHLGEELGLHLVGEMEGVRNGHAVLVAGLHHLGLLELESLVIEVRAVAADFGHVLKEVVEVAPHDVVVVLVDVSPDKDVEKHAVPLRCVLAVEAEGLGGLNEAGLLVVREEGVEVVYHGVELRMLVLAFGDDAVHLLEKLRGAEPLGLGDGVRLVGCEGVHGLVADADDIVLYEVDKPFLREILDGFLEGEELDVAQTHRTGEVVLVEVVASSVLKDC